MSIETSELEEWADQYVTGAFTNLYKTDLFLLDRLQNYPVAYDAMLNKLLDDWTVPDEEQKVVEEQLATYCPKPRRRKR